jgi:hypothetical protein
VAGVGIAVAAGVAALPAAVTQAAQEPVVTSAPADVFNLGDCTGFAVSTKVVLTAKHCEPTTSNLLVSWSGKRPQIQRVIDVPGTDVTALVTDAHNLAPFAVKEVDREAGVSVYGYGRSVNDPDPGEVMRHVELAGGPPYGQDVVWTVRSPGETACLGDSGAPALQEGSVVAVVTSVDEAPCGKRLVGGVPVAPAYRWLQRHVTHRPAEDRHATRNTDGSPGPVERVGKRVAGHPLLGRWLLPR